MGLVNRKGGEFEYIMEVASLKNRLLRSGSLCPT